jgi:nucleoredoxin
MKMRLLPLLVSLFLPAVPGVAATLEQLIANPALWPKEVSVTAATKAAVIKEGKPSGMMLIGAGKKITLTGVAADGITGKLGGATVKVAVAKTNLLDGGGDFTPEPSGVETAADGAAVPVRPTASGNAPSAMQRQLSSKLVRLEQGNLRSVNTDTALAGVKYYAFYYSASWCGPCRRFTPQFAKIYRQMKQQHPEFEVVFVSADRSAQDMAGYMKDDGMPWLALKYDLVGSSGLQRYSGPGIPSLVLMDANGKVLSQSYEGDNYVGPGKVLQDAQRILARGI